MHNCLKNPKVAKNPQRLQITGYNVLKLRLIIKGLSSPSADHSRLFSWVLANGQNSLNSCMSWHVYGCLSLFLIISLLYSWKLYLHVRQKQETVPLEEFLPYVKLGKAVGGRGWGMWGKHRSRDFNWKSSLPSPAMALPPFPHITNGKLQRMRTDFSKANN